MVVRPPAGESWASSPATRRTMQANRGRDTGPEMTLRRACFALGLRYRVSVRPEAGARSTADMVFPRARVAVYVDGCFWHGCPLHYVPPKTNDVFWAEKVRGNRERDERVTQALTAAGWSVLRFWEHEDMRGAAAVVEAHVVVRVDAGTPRPVRPSST